MPIATLTDCFAGIIRVTGKLFSCFHIALSAFVPSIHKTSGQSSAFPGCTPYHLINCTKPIAFAMGFIFFNPPENVQSVLRQRGARRIELFEDRALQKLIVCL